MFNKGLITKNPFLDFKIKRDEIVPVSLTRDELKRIAGKKFTIKRLNQVRDIFLFSCYTGLAYGDVYKLRTSDIIIGIDGGKWIVTSRQKTASHISIPLLPMALIILMKYQNHPKRISNNTVLPVMSNQKMNAYLKDIADVCSVNKNLTFHAARHTFATTITLTNGVPIETVSKMLGHKSLKQTQHYARVLDVKVSKDMKLLKKRLKS